MATVVLLVLLVAGSWWLTVVDASVNGNTWVGLLGSVLGGAMGGLVAVLIYRHTLEVERAQEDARRAQEQEQQVIAWHREREARREAMRSDVGLECSR